MLSQKCVNVQNHMVELLVQIVCKVTTKHIVIYYYFSQLCVVIVTVQVVGLVQLAQLV